MIEAMKFILYELFGSQIVDKINSVPIDQISAPCSPPHKTYQQVGLYVVVARYPLAANLCIGIDALPASDAALTTSIEEALHFNRGFEKEMKGVSPPKNHFIGECTLLGPKSSA